MATSAIVTHQPPEAPHRFPYMPITEPDGIRLAVIRPASNQLEAIRCSLIHTTLSICDYDVIDHYTALSYVWGDATELKTIWIDDLPVQITRNLYAALVDLRDETRDFRLWADALCINQQDDAEKDTQVSMMGRIYEAAGHTIIHLPSSHDPALSMIHSSDEHGSSEVPASILATIQASSWLTRVWVFQELILSKDPWVYCGGRQRWRWNDVCRANSKTLSLYSSGDTRDETYEKGIFTSGPMIIASMQQVRKAHHEEKAYDMLDLVRARRGMGATDPRDIIWAHTGLAADGKEHALKIDYKNRTLEDLYNEFAVHVFERECGLKILFHVESRTSAQLLDGLASWSPDWRCSHQADRTRTIIPESRQVIGSETKEQVYSHHKTDAYYFGQYYFSKSYKSTYLCRTTFDRTLACNGFRSDFVQKVSKPLSKSSFPKEICADFQSRFHSIITRWQSISEMARWQFIRKGQSELSRFDQDLAELYNECAQLWCTFIHEHDLLNECPNMKYVHLRLFLNSICRPSTVHQAGPPFARLTIRDWLVAQFCNSIFEDTTIEEKSLALMGSGLVAIVPTSTQPGDFLIGGMEPKVQSHVLQNSWYRPRFLMRSEPIAWDAEKSSQLRAKMKDISQGSRSSRYKGSFYHGAPMQHCSFVGVSLMFGLSGDSESNEETSVISLATVNSWAIYVIH